MGGEGVACFQPPAPAAVPRQLFDDSPGAAELVLPLKGRRVGVYWALFEDATPEVVAACRHAVALLEEHGCEVGCLPGGPALLPALLPGWPTDRRFGV